MSKSVLIALSGGIHSLYAAYILKEKSYKVSAVTFKIWPEISDQHKALEIERVANLCQKMGQ